MTLYRAADQAVDESIWFLIDTEVVPPCLDFSVLGNYFRWIEELASQPAIGSREMVENVLALD